MLWNAAIVWRILRRYEYTGALVMGRRKKIDVNTDIRIVRQIKNSLAPSDGEIRFSITAEMGFQWLECKSTFVSSEQPKVPEFESKTEKAAYLIKKLLSDGDMRAREIYMRMKDEGISRRTAENTKKELGIRSYRKMRQWYWSIHTGE